MRDVFIDTFMDIIKIVPFLFVAFLLIELLEHKLSEKSEKLIKSNNKYGPIIGSLLGILPQCGFSVMATNLYVTRIITLGTLMSIYLSTSDEMLPILLSEGASFNTIFSILIVKVITGIIFGIIIDFIIKKKNIKTSNDYDICMEDDCHCEKGIIHSVLIHTLKAVLFISIITLLLNTLMHYIGDDLINKLFLKDSIYAPILSSLIGLIPNCGSSIVLSELYLKGAISFASVIAGLLTNSGIGILILFKSNKNIKENIFIIGSLYLIGVIVGIIFEIINFII